MLEPQFDNVALRFLWEARRAVLTTIDLGDGRPRSVPICFVAISEPGRSLVLVSPLDEKPKSSADPRTLRRVRNLFADPRATILIDRWDEDWSRLIWLSLDAEGWLLEPGERGHERAVAALREKYPQYLDHDLEGRPMLRFETVGATSWAASDAAP